MVGLFTEVWTSLTTWLASTFGSITALFYTAPGTGETVGSLTFIGTLGVIMAGVSLILLVFNLIRSFLVARA